MLIDVDFVLENLLILTLLVVVINTVLNAGILTILASSWRRSRIRSGCSATITTP